MKVDHWQVSHIQGFKLNVGNPELVAAVIQSDAAHAYEAHARRGPDTPSLAEGD